MRRDVYARLVASGKLGESVARDRILIIEAILEDYRSGRKM